jgi:hypothetical protein
VLLTLKYNMQKEPYTNPENTSSRKSKLQTHLSSKHNGHTSTPIYIMCPSASHISKIALNTGKQTVIGLRRV